MLALDSQQGEGVPEFLRPHYPTAAHSGGHPVGYVIIRFVTNGFLSEGDSSWCESGGGKGGGGGRQSNKQLYTVCKFTFTLYVSPPSVYATVH